MPITIIGAVEDVLNGETANTGTISSTITVPSDAELVIATFHGFKTEAGHFSGGSMTFTKGGVDTAMTLVPDSSGADSDTGAYQGVMFYLVNPDTGTNKSLKWDWAGTGTLDDGARLCTFAFFKGIDTASPVRDGGGDNQAGSASGGSPVTTATMTAASGDLIYAVAWGHTGSGPGSVDTWTNLTNLQNRATAGGSIDAQYATGSPSGNVAVGYTAVTDLADGGIVAVVLKPAAAGGSPYTLTAESGTVTLSGQAAGLTIGPWEIVGVGTSVQVTATSHALTLPAGVQQGDLLVAVISSRIASTTSITLPSGGEWTACAEQKTNNVLTTGSAVASGLMAYCIRGSSDPNLTFTHPTAPSVALGRVIAYRGSYVGGWLDQSTSATTAVSTTAVSVSGVTTTFPSDLIVVGLCGGQEATWSAVDATNPSVASGATDTTTRPTANTWIERAEQVTTTGSDTSLAIADGVRSTAGATGNITATASVAASHVVLVGAFRSKVVSLAPYTMAADTGTITLAGQTVVPKVTLPISDGDLVLGGQAAALRITRKVVALTGTLTLAGQAATLIYSRKIKMAVDAGTLTLAGQVAALRTTRKLAAELGTLTLAGQPATLKRSYVMPAGTGTLTLVGETVILIKSAAVMHYIMPADPGTVIMLGGQVIALRATRKLTAATGTLALAGQAVVPKVTLPVSSGTLTLGGQTTNLRVARKVVAGTGTLLLTGQTAVLRSVRKLVAGTGTLTLGGQTVVPKVALPAGTGALALSGQPAILRVAHKLTAGTGTLTLAGPPVILTWSASGVTTMPAGLGLITLGGQTVNLRYARKMAAAHGVLTSTGHPANLVYTPSLIDHYILDAGRGTLALTGQVVALDVARVIVPPVLPALEAQPGRLTFGRRVSVRRW